MNIYIYAADCFCEDCGNALKGRLKPPENPGDERTFDSNFYPKGPYSDGGGEADSPQHCGSGPNCLNALDVGGVKVGCWLENELTNAGARYVAEAVAEGGPVAALWAQWYKEELENVR